MRHFSPLFWHSVLIGLFAALIGACAEHKVLAFGFVLLLAALFNGAWVVTECRRLLVLLQRARRIRQVSAARAPVAICTDDIH